MEELKDTSIHHTATKIVNAIKVMNNYDNILQSVQEIACHPNVDKHDLRNSLEDAIKTSGLETDIRNAVFHLVRKNQKSETTFQKNDMEIQEDQKLLNLELKSLKLDMQAPEQQQLIEQTKQQLQENQEQPAEQKQQQLEQTLAQPLELQQITQQQQQQQQLQQQQQQQQQTPEIQLQIKKPESSIPIKQAPLENKMQKAKNNDPMNYLLRTGTLWDRRVRKSLTAMCGELKVPIQGQPRLAAEREIFVTKWEELSNYTIDVSSYRPVYAPKDLLDVLMSMKGPTALLSDHNEFIDIPKWEFSHIDLPVKNLSQLYNLFSEIIRYENYNGVMDLNVQCEKVLETKHAPVVQQLLKKGTTPMQYRAAMYSVVLGSEMTPYDYEYWEKIKSSVLNTDHIVDKLIFKDIQLTATNDDQYFVFEDVLYQIMLCFTRDNEVSELINHTLAIKAKIYDGVPNGIVPFHGISMFASPFCYLFDRPNVLYFTFRAFYIRYGHRLAAISTHPQGIVCLCLTFERLLQTHEPILWSHLRDLNIPPLRIVFKWIMRAFSGHLPPDQLFVLWDFILGFDSLEILPLFALIVLSFRKESILQVKSFDAIEAVLADLSSIRVLPLVQLALTNFSF